MKDGSEINNLWALLDEKKLQDRIQELISAFQKSRHEYQSKCLLQVDEKMRITPIDAKVAKYPALNQFTFSMVNTSIHSLLRGIVMLDEKTGENLLNFKMFNGKVCTLPSCSTSYRLFKQNAYRSKWIDAMLLGLYDDKEVAAEQVIHF